MQSDFNTQHKDNVAKFYDDRVGNDEDLNTKLGKASGHRRVHHHSGIVPAAKYVNANESVPHDEKDALKWLFDAEETLTDMMFEFAQTHSTKRIKTVLDLGCGEGGTLMRFYELNQQQQFAHNAGANGHAKRAKGDDLEVYGITLSEKQRSIAKSLLPQGNWICGDFLETKGHSPPLKENFFDLIVSTEATTYLGVSKLGQFFSNCSHWLSNDGMLVIVDGTLSSFAPWDDPAVKIFNNHYKCIVSRTCDYQNAAKQAGLRFVGEIDLVPSTINYWRARRDRKELWNSEGGRIEAMLVQSMERRVADFRLFAWSKASLTEYERREHL